MVKRQKKRQEGSTTTTSKRQDLSDSFNHFPFLCKCFHKVQCIDVFIVKKDYFLRKSIFWQNLRNGAQITAWAGCKLGSPPAYSCLGCWEAECGKSNIPRGRTGLVGLNLDTVLLGLL
jgi:hypothetical protein